MTPSNHASEAAPRNIPGDLRWDKSELTNGRELMVGRIDFAGLPAFSESEVQLLVRYFHKNHAFRHGYLQASRQGFWTTTLPYLDRTVSNMTSYFGANATTFKGGLTTWATITNDESFLWGAAGASGAVHSTTGISTREMANSDYKVVFSTAGASWMMQTWQPNSAIRALIAMPTWGIGSIVSHGFYGEVVHPAFSMGRPLGELNLGPVGRFQRVVTLDTGIPEFIQKSIHADLHGDPLVTMYVTEPPSNLRVSGAGAATLQWDASTTSGLVGYHVYRSSGLESPFQRLTSEPVTGTTYIDSARPSGAVVYMVRAVNRETRGTDTYFAESQGIFASLTAEGVGNSRPSATAFSVVTNEDIAPTINLGGTDPDNDSLLPILVETPKNGRLLASGGNFSYVPNRNFNGADSFEFVVSDGFQESAPARVNITVSAVNDSPILAPITFTAHSYRGVATVVRLNATDAEGDAVTYRVGTAPLGGRASISGNHLSYLPNPSFTGTETFTVVAADPIAESAPTTVTVTVTQDLALENSTLRAWWRFDETPGGASAVDSNPNSTKYPATLNNGASVLAGSGVIGGALQTSGAQQSARVSAVPVSGVVYNAATSLWFNAVDPGNDARFQVLHAMGGVSNANWNVYLRGGSLYVHFRRDPNTTYRTDTVIIDGIQPNVWNHVVFSHRFPADSTRLGESVDVYLNGTLRGRMAGQAYNISQPMMIGNQGGWLPFHNDRTRNFDSWFNGWIDDVRYYSTALTAPQVRALYHLGVPAAPNQPPLASATASISSGAAPLAVRWLASASNDPDGTIVSYTWNFSDGGSAVGETVDRVHSGPGAVTGTVTIVDNEGATSVATATVQVLPATTTRGTPIQWLVGKFGPLQDPESVDLGDPDGDGQPTWLEYRSGTDPSDGHDSFRILSTSKNADDSVTLVWRGSSENGVTTPFRVLRTFDLASGVWHVAAAAVPRSESGTTSWTDPSSTSSARVFYRIESP